MNIIVFLLGSVHNGNSMRSCVLEWLHTLDEQYYDQKQSEFFHSTQLKACTRQASSRYVFPPDPSGQVNVVVSV